MSSIKQRRNAPQRRRAVASAPRPPPAVAPQQPDGSLGHTPALRWLAVMSLLAAGVIHARYMSVHLEEWVAAGVSFTILTALQLGLGLGLLLRADAVRSLSFPAVGLSLGTVVVWVVSRTAGLPFGPGGGIAEPIGRADSIATILELVTVAALLPLALRPPTEVKSEPVPLGLYPVLSAAGALMMFGLGFALAQPPSEHVHLAGQPGRELPEGLLEQEELSEEQQAALDDLIPLAADDRAFSTDRLELAAGQAASIHFQNNDSEPHNLTILDGDKPLFRGEIADEGEVVRYVFRPPPRGTYEFSCDIHPGMKGTVRVD